MTCINSTGTSEWEWEHTTSDFKADSELGHLRTFDPKEMSDETLSSIFGISIASLKLWEYRRSLSGFDTDGLASLKHTLRHLDIEFENFVELGTNVRNNESKKEGWVEMGNKLKNFYRYFRAYTCACTHIHTHMHTNLQNIIVMFTELCVSGRCVAFEIISEKNGSFVDDGTFSVNVEGNIINEDMTMFWGAKIMVGCLALRSYYARSHL